MDKNMRMGVYGYPIPKMMTCNQKTIASYLRLSTRDETVTSIMFGMDNNGDGQVFSEGLVARVLEAMIKNGKVVKRGEYYSLNDSTDGE